MHLLCTFYATQPYASHLTPLSSPKSPRPSSSLQAGGGGSGLKAIRNAHKLSKLAQARYLVITPIHARIGAHFTPHPPHHAPSAASPAPTPLICLYGTPSPPSTPTPLQSDGPAAAYMVTQQAFWRQRLQRIDHWEGQQKARLAREAARAARSDGAAKAALILQAGCSLGLLPRVAAWGCSLGLPPGHVGLQPLTRLRRSYCMPYDFAWLYLLWLSCRRPSVLIRSVRRSTPRRRRS
jgi:hypothetical protein